MYNAHKAIYFFKTSNGFNLLTLFETHNDDINAIIKAINTMKITPLISNENTIWECSEFATIYEDTIEIITISIIEMIKALDHITPGIANDHTLLYGVEAKFYSDRVECGKNFETKIKNLYVSGDGAGITRGLAQAGANGVFIARDILKKEGEELWYF